MKRSAFTMLELVMVIIVVGILAALALPRIDRDLKQEAADHILSNIRYTQHLALNDKKHKFDDPNWQRRFWSLAFSTCSDGTAFLRIGSDDDGSSGSAGLFGQTEAAIDPLNGKPLWTADSGNCDANTVSENIKIGSKYGVSVGNGDAGTGCAGVKHIGFDHLGRPHVSFGTSSTPNYASYMRQRCSFTFTLSDGDTFQLHIEPETGYAFIDDHDAS